MWLTSSLSRLPHLMHWHLSRRLAAARAFVQKWFRSQMCRQEFWSFLVPLQNHLFLVGSPHIPQKPHPGVQSGPAQVVIV